MKKMLYVLPAAALLFATAGSATTVATTTATTDANTVSYAMGYKTGQAFKQQSVNINPQQFSQGLEDAYTGKKSAISEQEMQTALVNMQKQMVEKMKEHIQNEAEENKKAGEAFLAANAKKEGVVTTPSGLQYKVIDAGSGESPSLKDTVTVNYSGEFINGKVFDSSYQRGTPATFKVGQVIKGWQEALTMMKPGATWMVYIPSDLAYGKQGAMGAIGPNETLVFKVNLISVKK